MDYSYITPRCLPQLRESVLIQTLAEYRYAAEILSNDDSPESDELHQQLLSAVALLEEELSRREEADLTEP